MARMNTLEMTGGGAIPVLGLGTWRMGEQASQRTRELAALRSALAMGYRLFDTAEMYGEGGAEQLLGEALGAALRAGEVAARTCSSSARPTRTTPAGAACPRPARAACSAWAWSGSTWTCCTGAAASRSPRRSTRCARWSMPGASGAGA